MTYVCADCYSDIVVLPLVVLPRWVYCERCGRRLELAEKP